MIMKCTLIYYNFFLFIFYFNNNGNEFLSFFCLALEIHLERKKTKKSLHKFQFAGEKERRKASLMNKISRFVQINSMHVVIRYLWHFLLAGTRNNGHSKMMRNFHVYTLNECRHS